MAAATLLASGGAMAQDSYSCFGLGGGQTRGLLDEALKACLVRVKGLDAARVKTVARGENTPVTFAQDCQGKTARADVIACLQPDRRVEIEVSGTR